MRILLLGTDNVLYDADKLRGIAREWAITVMREAGLPVEHEAAMEALLEVIREKGQDYPRHFNEMMRRLGLKEDIKVVAAGVIAYHDVKRAFLRPLPGIVEAVTEARRRGIFVGIYSRGDPIKEWEKVIRLGVHHLIDGAWIGPDERLRQVLSGFDLGSSIFVTGDPAAADEALKIGVGIVGRVDNGRIEIWDRRAGERYWEKWDPRNVVLSLLEKP